MSKETTVAGPGIITGELDNLVWGTIRNYPWDKHPKVRNGDLDLSINSPYLFVSVPFALSGSFKDLEGKLLTLVDASITDENQLSAVKSMVRQIIWEAYFTLYGAYIDKKDLK